MKSVIAIRAVANTGKTTTIKKVYEVLKRSHPNSVVREILNRKEITIIIIIDDVKIGIESQGDPKQPSRRKPQNLC